MQRAKRGAVSSLAMVSVSGFALLAMPSFAQSDEEERVEETVFVVGDRDAYKGNFDVLEVPAADLTIDAALLTDAGALNLSEALDLSASVARQNNFGGLWNAFSVRGFAGDCPSPLNLGQIDLSDFGGSGRIEDGSEAVFG